VKVSLRLDNEEIQTATGFDDSSDENTFVEKIVDDIVFVVAEEIVDELELQSYSHHSWVMTSESWLVLIFRQKFQKSSYGIKLREKIDKLVESKEEQNKEIANLKKKIEKLKKENAELQKLPNFQIL